MGPYQMATGRAREAGAVVRAVPVPGAARALSSLEHIDYADAFLVDIQRPGRRTAEQWVRAIFDESANTLRLRLWSGWMVIGLRLAPPFATGHVLGWEIRRSTPESVLLGARSRIGMPAELLVSRQGEGLLFDTFVQQNNRIARAVWSAIEPTHRSVVPALLRQFMRRA
jgi:hypothetical protein